MNFTMNFASIRQTVANKLSNAATWVENTAVPAVIEHAKTTVDHVDDGANTVNTSFVKFLINHPGISMTLSAGTVIKAVAAHHVDQIIKEQTGKSTEAHTARVATLYTDSNCAQ